MLFKKVPTGHSRHRAVPVAFAKVPRGQLLQASEPRLEVFCPREQAVQDVIPVKSL